MQCELCGRSAKLQFTEVVGGQKRTLWMCARCASEHGVMGNDAPPSESPASPPALQPEAVLEISIGATTPGRRCSNCGTTLLAIRKSGRVGCPEWYTCFREFLEPLLKRVHGVLQHRGLSPGGLSDRARRREERARLREDLRQAIAAEDYETAARLRDRLQDEGPQAGGSESA